MEENPGFKKFKTKVKSLKTEIRKCELEYIATKTCLKLGQRFTFYYHKGVKAWESRHTMYIRDIVILNDGELKIAPKETKDDDRFWNYVPLKDVVTNWKPGSIIKK